MVMHHNVSWTVFGDASTSRSHLKTRSGQQAGTHYLNRSVTQPRRSDNSTQTANVTVPFGLRAWFDCTVVTAWAVRVAQYKCINWTDVPDIMCSYWQTTDICGWSMFDQFWAPLKWLSPRYGTWCIFVSLSSFLSFEVKHTLHNICFYELTVYFVAFVYRLMCGSVWVQTVCVVVVCDWISHSG